MNSMYLARKEQSRFERCLLYCLYFRFAYVEFKSEKLVLQYCQRKDALKIAGVDVILDRVGAKSENKPKQQTAKELDPGSTCPLLCTFF